MGRAREQGESVTHSSTHPPPLRHPHHCPPFLLRSSGERAGGDAAGDHEVLTLFRGCPLALEGPVHAAQLPSPLFVLGCDLYACGPCLKSSWAEGRSEAKDGSPRCVIVLSPSTTVVLST